MPGNLLPALKAKEREDQRLIASYRNDLTLLALKVEQGRYFPQVSNFLKTQPSLDELKDKINLFKRLSRQSTSSPPNNQAT